MGAEPGKSFTAGEGVGQLTTNLCLIPVGAGYTANAVLTATPSQALPSSPSGGEETEARGGHSAGKLRAWI